MSSQKEIEVLLGAACPIICVFSSEERRVEAALARILQKRQERTGSSTDLFTWTITSGLHNITRSEVFSDEDSPLSVLDFIEERRSTGVFILKDYGHYLKQEGPGLTVVRRLKDLARSLTTDASVSGKHIVLVGNEFEVPQDLEIYMSVVDFELPDRVEIKHALSKSLENAPQVDEIVEDREKFKEDPELARVLVDSCVGLSLFEIESVAAKSIVSKRKLDVSTMLSEKKQIIKKSGVLEYYDTSLDLNDVGGLRYLKEWLQMRGRAFSEEAKAYGLPNPKGVLIVGIPGTGKSLVSKAVGKAWNMPILRMDVGALFGSFVGQSEANMRKALKTAEAMAPCVLWIDELEKSMSSSSGGTDGGTTARVFGSFLSWMQEKKSPVFVVATANDVSSLPPEMLRKGRFDELFFVDLPSIDDRKDIFRIHLNKLNRDVEQFNLEELAGSASGFSGAEIESSIISALYSSFNKGREVTSSDIVKQCGLTVPLSQTMASKLEAIRKWAESRARLANDVDDFTRVIKPSTHKRVVDLQ